MPRKKRDLRTIVAMCQRNTNIRSSSERGSYPRHDFEGNIVLLHLLNFFTTSTEHKGITTFQTHNRKAFASTIDQYCFNFVLWYGVTSSLFAHINLFTRFTRPGWRFATAQ